MLFFDDTTLALMKQRFARGRWPDFSERFLLQSAPATLQGGYDALRWNGREFATARTTDAKFASWIITENSVAFKLSDNQQHLEAAAAWVTAALNTVLWQPQFKGNADLFHGNLLYALSMFLDLCGGQIAPELRERVERTLLERGRVAIEWFVCKPPHEQRYTQNHFYIPMTGLLCAALVLKDHHAEAGRWIEHLRVYPPLIVDALGRDGYFFEGPDYFHYAFIWLVRLAELSELHLGLRLGRLPPFAKLRHFLRWMYYPQGESVFAIGDASAKEYNFARWGEQEGGQKLMSDNRLQNFSHVLMWAGMKNGDAESSALAREIRSRGAFHWYEGFWCLAWEGPQADTGAPGSAETSHWFGDHGVWCGDSGSLRVIAKCGSPLGRSMPLRDGQPAYAYDAGHCHPDAGSVLAAIGDAPVLLGPGYLGRKSGCYLNSLTFDGRGQEDDRLYHALDAVAYARFNALHMKVESPHRVVMEFASAYPDSLGVQLVTRSVELKDSHSFQIEDRVQLSMARRSEARFRISDPPLELRSDRVVWRVGHRIMQFCVTESSVDFSIFVAIGEVISINDDGRPGPFEAGSVNQRGYQILVRPREKVEAWHARYLFTIA